MQSSSSIAERRSSFNSWRAEPRSPWGECVSSPVGACRARGCDAAFYLHAKMATEVPRRAGARWHS